jgi:phosphate transport system substrate-binding protein
VLRRLLLAVATLALVGGPPARALAQGFSGAGSTFAHPILARWGQVFATIEGEGGAHVSDDRTLDYEPVGSLGGVMRVLQGAVDFGVTDVALPPEELTRHGLAQFPFVTGGVAVVVNLRGVASTTLRLSGPVLAGIYLGAILRWSDPAIAALNPAISLPDAPIAVLRRLDGSGTTYHFAAYLAGASPEWRARVGVDTSLQWPVGAGAKGNQELAEQVRATANAIGYVEASQAVRLGLAVVLLENRAGRFVAPDRASLQAASATAAWDPGRHFHQGLAAPEGAGAYPIVATVFALVPRRPRSAARSRLTLNFFRLALTERGADAASLGYVPLPDPVVRQVTDYWRASIAGAR